MIDALADTIKPFHVFALLTIYWVVHFALLLRLVFVVESFWSRCRINDNKHLKTFQETAEHPVVSSSLPEIEELTERFENGTVKNAGHF
mgnify:CR=1 FL=1